MSFLAASAGSEAAKNAPKYIFYTIVGLVVLVGIGLLVVYLVNPNALKNSSAAFGNSSGSTGNVSGSTGKTSGISNKGGGSNKNPSQ